MTAKPNETQSSRIIRKLYGLSSTQAEWVRTNYSREFQLASLTHLGYCQPTCLYGSESLKRIEEVIDRLRAARPANVS